MYDIKYMQKLPISLEQSWDFFSSPSNLKILTPEYLSFEITNQQDASKIYAGQIIAYLIRPIWNFPVKWVTEITHAEKPHYFIDEQRFGPYKFWHHEHWFKSIPGGVEMTDIIYYTMPFGIIGKALHTLKVKRDIEAIFTYRQAKLEQMYGRYVENGVRDSFT
jgi:ligand-binding SRPBCC domain-containing protein